MLTSSYGDSGVGGIGVMLEVSALPEGGRW
jgi:hypothetical protein